jgi:hypothetical protein
MRDGRGRGRDKPTVARPPNFIFPNRANGTERVVTPGTNSLITIESSGFCGTSLSAIFSILVCVVLLSRRDVYMICIWRF